MKTKTLALVVSLLSSQVFAQTAVESITLETQADIDNFNYTSIANSLYIMEKNPGAITNLDGLSGLTEIGFELVIRDNINLANIDGLSALKTVQEIEITNNGSLANLDGLLNLEKLGVVGSGYQYRPARIEISDNTALTSIDGLKNTVGTVDRIIIDNNESLLNLDGLVHLQFNPISGDAGNGGTLRLSNNNNLQNACGGVGIWSVPRFNYVIPKISNNAPATESVAKIKENCQPCASVHSGDLLLSSQADIDNFNYCEVSGTLTIEENITDDIVNLKGLAGLTKVGRLHVLRNNKLLTLNGLNTVTEMADVASNTQQAYTLQIVRNNGLKRTQGLNNLSSINGNVGISRNVQLLDVGANSLISVTGDIGFYLHHRLELIDFSGLGEIDKGLNLKTNLALDTINLSYVDSIGGSLNVQFNPKLQTLNFLENLTSVGGDLSVTKNSALTSACTLANVLINNTVDGTTTISDNNPTNTNTNSAAEIINACTY